MAEVEEARSIAPSTSAVSSPTVAAMTSTVEPAPAVSAVIVVAAVSVGSVVAARGFVFVVPTATTRAKGDAYDHNYSHHDRNYKKRSHSDSPLSDFPNLCLILLLCGRCIQLGAHFGWVCVLGGFETRPYDMVGYEVVGARTRALGRGSYTLWDSRND